jgi:helicase
MSKDDVDSGSVSICLETVKMGKQALVFCSSKRAAEKQAEDVAKLFKKTLISTEHQGTLAKVYSSVLSPPTKQCLRGAYCLSSGVAFHHAGLTSEQRELIEEGFKSGVIRIICSTPTLAAGLNMPAFRTILKDMKRYDSRWGMQYISVLEYLQMAGRAGRPGQEAFGEAIMIASTEAEKQKLKERFIDGEVENIQSKLAVEPVLRFHVLSLIASNFVRSVDELMNFFEKTFYAKQFGDASKMSATIMRVLKLLEEYSFINISSAGDFVSANDVFGEKVSATPLGKRVAELYLDPYTAHELLELFAVFSEKRKLIPQDKIAFSLLQSFSLAIEMRPLLRVKVKEEEEIQSVIIETEDYLLPKIPDEFDLIYDEWLSSVKTALFLNAWISETDEEILLERFDVRPGETRAKLDIFEWLVSSSIELCRFVGLQEIIGDLVKLQIRMKYGVKEELLPLLKLKGIGRVRARQLFKAGYCTLGDLKKASIANLKEVIGATLAASVIKQVGGSDKEDGSLKDFL